MSFGAAGNPQEKPACPPEATPTIGATPWTSNPKSEDQPNPSLYSVSES